MVAMAARAPARMFFGNKNKGKGKGKEGSAPKKPATLGELAALNTARFKGAKSASGGAAGFANAKKVRTCGDAVSHPAARRGGDARAHGGAPPAPFAGRGAILISPKPQFSREASRRPLV